MSNTKLSWTELYDRHMAALYRTGYLEGIMLGVAIELDHAGNGELADYLRKEAKAGSFAGRLENGKNNK